MPPYNPNLTVNNSLKKSNLVTLRTDLKSLRYGSDRPGGGSSGQPYIQTRIPSSNLVSLNPDTLGGAGNTNPIYGVNSTGGLDFPIRGGTIEVNLGSQTFTLSSRIDQERIRKFYDDDPRGATFKRKQIELQLTNPITQTGNSFFKLGSEFSDLGVRGLLQNNRVYNNGKNTLTSVGLSGTGLRATRQGLIPIDTQAKYYFDVVSAESRLSTYEVNNTNRLLILNNLKMTSGATFNNPFAGIGQANRLGISLNKNLLFDYLTGPGSVYGLGKTTIKRSKDSDTRGAATKYTSMKGMTYDNIISQNLNNTTDGIRTTAIQAGYVTGSIDTREKIYSYNINIKGKATSDKINLAKIVTVADDPWSTKSLKANKDIIKFGFECINNDHPAASVFLQFRAYLDGGISDSNQGEWNSFRYVGRGEEFFTYQGFTRTITFAFKIAAQSSDELLPIYNKINYLVSQVYPDYSSDNIMRAPIVRVTIGDYLYRVPGILQNVNLQIDQATSWEIRDTDEKGNLLGELPQHLSVNITFKPIMDELPKRSKDGYTSNLIANKKNAEYERDERVNTLGKKINEQISAIKSQVIMPPLS